MKEESIMKKIQKSIMMLAALLTAGAALTSCSNEESIAEEQNANGKYIMTVEATKGSDALTRALAIDGEGSLNATWTAGDVVEAYLVEVGSTSKLGELTAQSDGVTTKLTGALDEMPAVGDDIYLAYPAYVNDYTRQIGTLDDIAANFDYAHAVVKATAIDNDAKTITTESAVFENDQSIVKFTLSTGGNNINATSLTVGLKNGSDDYFQQDYITTGDITIAPASGTNEIWAALATWNTSEATLSLIASTDSKVYFYTKDGVSFNNGKYYTASVDMKELIKLNSSNAMSVIGGAYTQVTAEQALKLAKAQAALTGNTTYVVFYINGMTSASYAASTDNPENINTYTGTNATVAQLMNLYGSGDAYAVGQ